MMLTYCHPVKPSSLPDAMRALFALPRNFNPDELNISRVSSGTKWPLSATIML
jgi:hypothetical protein